MVGRSQARKTAQAHVFVSVEWLCARLEAQALNTPSGARAINLGITLKTSVIKKTPSSGPNNAQPNKKALTRDEIIAIRYQRLINIGFIPKTKANSNIPPLNAGHKSAYTKAIKHVGVKRAAEQPAQVVPFKLKDPARMAEMLAVNGLSDWQHRGVLCVPTNPHERVTLAEKVGTVTKRHNDGTVLVIHFGVDYNDLLANDALPEVFYSTRKHTKKTADQKPPRKIAPIISSLNPSNWQPMGDKWDYEGYISEGYKYKETQDGLLGGLSTLVYIYNTTPNKKTGKTERELANEMTARFKHSTTYRKV